MKKLVLLALLATFSFGNMLVCKSESTLHQIGSKDEQSFLPFVSSMIEDGECRVISSYTLIHKGQYISKVRYGSERYYTMSSFIK